MQKHLNMTCSNAKQLGCNGLILKSVDEIVDEAIPSTEGWTDFVSTWNNLPTDQYMNDGGTYRQRRFSRFHLDIVNGTLRQKEHAPYSQPKHLNSLNGGTLRHFEPILDSTASMNILKNLLTDIGKLLSEVDKIDEWDINVYQNRTLANENIDGKPVPEGMHRDGVRYSVLLGIGRNNVDGAESTVFDDNQKPIFTHTLLEGDLLIFCDEICYHDTTAVALREPEIKTGTRDVLVIEYYTSLGNKNQYYVK